jgi:polysaccharide pyruvyl transferase WcaK-like protein
MTAAGCFPRLARAAAIPWSLYKALRLAVLLTRRLHDRPVVVIGGGNLLSDVALNFPLKLTAVRIACWLRDCRYIVFAVGVERNWSHVGAALFRSFLGSTRCVDVSVRDIGSANAIKDQVASTPCEPKVVRDPALSLPAVHPSPSVNGSQVVTIFVQSSAQARFAGANQAVSLEDTALEMYTNLQNHFEGRGQSVVFATSGAPEDSHMLGRSPLHPQVTPSTVKDLVGIICNSSLVVSSRLHPLLIAHAYGVPTQVLGTSSKIRGFLELGVGTVSRAATSAGAARDGRPENSPSTYEQSQVEFLTSCFQRAIDTP